MAAACFFSRYLNSPLPYVLRHITVNKNVFSASLKKPCPLKYIRYCFLNVLRASLNKTFPSSFLVEQTDVLTIGY